MRWRASRGKRILCRILSCLALLTRQHLLLSNVVVFTGSSDISILIFAVVTASSSSGIRMEMHQQSPAQALPHQQQQQQHHQQQPQPPPTTQRSVSSQPASYLQHIPGINMNLPANDPSVRTIKQHYYPEGGWGWVIVAVASFTHFITSPLTSPAISLLVIEIAGHFDQHFVSAGESLAASTAHPPPLIRCQARR